MASTLVSAAPHVPLLNHTCDRCPARTQRMAYKGDSVLEFCGHHSAVNHLELATQGWTLVELPVAQ